MPGASSNTSSITPETVFPVTFFGAAGQIQRRTTADRIHGEHLRHGGVAPERAADAVNVQLGSLHAGQGAVRRDGVDLEQDCLRERDGERFLRQLLRAGGAGLHDQRIAVQPPAEALRIVARKVLRDGDRLRRADLDPSGDPMGSSTFSAVTPSAGKVSSVA